MRSRRLVAVLTAIFLIFAGTLPIFASSFLDLFSNTEESGNVVQPVEISPNTEEASQDYVTEPQETGYSESYASQIEQEPPKDYLTGKMGERIDACCSRLIRTTLRCSGQRCIPMSLQSQLASSLSSSTKQCCRRVYSCPRAQSQTSNVRVVTQPSSCSRTSISPASCQGRLLTVRNVKIGTGCCPNSKSPRVFIIRIPQGSTMRVTSAAPGVRIITRTSSCPSSTSSSCPKRRIIIRRPSQSSCPRRQATTSSSAEPVSGDLASAAAAFKQKFGINLGIQNSSWTQEQIQAADQLLSALPKSFVSATTDIIREDAFRLGGGASQGVLGYVIQPQSRVFITDSGAMRGTRAFQRTLAHEMTHTFQNRYPQIDELWEKTFWPGGRRFVSQPPTRYGMSNPREDMAESLATYIFGPKNALTKDRYDFIKKYLMEGKEF